MIFVTAYNRYAIQAFKLSAIDYLLKPIEVDELKNAITLFEKRSQKHQFKALRNNLDQSQPQKIGLNGISSITFVDVDDILYFQADGSYTRVILQDNKTIIASKSLKHFENTLIDHVGFLRCHKSFIANLKHVTEYVKSDGGYLKIHQHEIGLSPDKVSLLLDRLTHL